MARGKRNSRRAAQWYADLTQRPLNCLVFILPLLAAYEIGALLLGHRLLAIAHLQHLLDVLGVTGRFLPPLLVVGALFVWHVASKQRWRPEGRALAGMVIESVLWMIPLLLLAALTRKLAAGTALSAGQATHSPAADILADIGAGIYEEFLFRLVAISVFSWLLAALRVPPKWSVAVAVVLSSVLFSLYHFIGPNEFVWHLFVFRAAAGAYLGAVYTTRGFGIAVGTHACYNVISGLM